MATTPQIIDAIAAVLNLDSQIGSTGQVMPYPGDQVQRFPCAIIYPPRARVQPGDAGLEAGEYTFTIHVLFPRLDSKAEGVRNAVALIESLRTLFRTHVCAAGVGTDMRLDRFDVVGVMYEKQPYLGVALSLLVNDEQAVLAEAGPVLI